jgi:hypothetical protein
LKHTAIIFLSLIVSLFISAGAIAAANQDPLGKITSYSGRFQVKQQDSRTWIDAATGMDVFFGDAIRTGEASEGVITLVDESFIQVRANSHIVLNTIISPLEKKNSILMFFGRVWSKVSKKAMRRKLFEVQTPTAVCGVRGTDFETGAYEDGTTLVQVNTGEVTIDNETYQKTVHENQGARLSYEVRDIRVEPGYKPDWEQSDAQGRKNLFADGEKYGGYVHTEIYVRRDRLKGMVQRTLELSEKKRQLTSAAETARDDGDTAAHEALLTEIAAINRELGDLNKQIAYAGGRLECQFGLFSHYGYLAKDPVLSKHFNGREFILKELDNIEMIQAEFDAMIEEGMKMSMEDMDDMMDEMRQKMRDYKNTKGNKDDLFDEM